MGDGFYASITVLGIAWAFAWLGVRVAEMRTRKKALESGATPEIMDRLFEEEEKFSSRYGALKWGAVITALGLGVLAEAVFPYSFADPIAYGVLLVIGGLALIGYYAYVETHLGDDGSPGHESPPPRPPAGDDASAGRGRPE